MTVRIFSILIFTLVAFSSLSTISAQAIPNYGVEVLHTYPHDEKAFTQGLEFRDGYLYEGTGLNGRSSVRKEELETGRVLQETPVSSEYFGEGITILHNELFELTWQSHIGFVYDQSSLHLVRKFSYDGEGWGLTNDGTAIYMSDGTPQIRKIDSKTLQELKRMTVHEGARQIQDLNELEWVHGEIWANVWRTDHIARISPRDGTVLGWIECSGLLSREEETRGADVLNGIAYDSANDRVFVTGKLWPKLFQIRLVRKS